MHGVFSWFRRRTPAAPTPRRRAGGFRPVFEQLEERQVPSVTYHGGALLPHVEVQALYYGSDWSTDQTYNEQTGYLERFLGNVVNSSYMDMLSNAGYRVGRGTFNQGVIDPSTIDKGQYLTDAALRDALQARITSGDLQAPDGNRLYVVFVEDNVAISEGAGNSQKNFLGYHGAFAGTDANGNPADIRYAVISYPGGSVGNVKLSWLTTNDQLTKVTSHELAEAVTDPDVNYQALGWYDDGAKEGEIGDLAHSQTVYLNRYAVQRIADANGQPMTPAGASAASPVTFVLQSSGDLWEDAGSGWTKLDSGIASLSSQGIDNFGHTMMDVVTTSGQALEFHENSNGGDWNPLWSGVASAQAGQGVSYVRFTDGSLWEYRDAGPGMGKSASWSHIADRVSSIGAGTDRYGVNMVSVIFTNGDAYEYSDTSSWHKLASGVGQVSAGQQGLVDYILNTGDAYQFVEATGGASFLAHHVAQISAGTDQSGNALTDLVLTSGDAWEYQAASGWTQLANNEQSVSKAQAGVVDLVDTGGDASQHDAAGNLNYLFNNAFTVA